MSSLEMIGRVWMSAMPQGTNKLVLLCFCAHLNDAAALSWPSVARRSAPSRRGGRAGQQQGLRLGIRRD